MPRETRQKNAIRKALFNAGRPLSVREVLEAAQREVTGLGVATVYRNLKALQEEKLIAQVDLPGQPSRWEVPEGHHHYFLCRVCDKLFEIRNCPEDLARLLPEGYTLEGHDIFLRGRCDNCVRKNNLAAITRRGKGRSAVRRNRQPS